MSYFDRPNHSSKKTFGFSAIKIKQGVTGKLYENDNNLKK